jgi:hypothetical protein
MSNHLSEQQIAGHRTGALSASEWLELHGHVAGCQECLGRLLSPEERERAAGALLRDLAAGDEPHEHVSFEEIKQFVDGRIDDAEREVVTSKIDSCDVCRTDSGELAAFSGELTRPQEQTRVPFRLPVRFAAAAAAVLAVVLFAWWLRRGANEPVAPIARGSSPHVPAPITAPPAPQQLPVVPEQRLAVALSDGDRRIGLGANGSLVGLDGLPEAERARIAMLLGGGNLPRAAALGRVVSRRVVLLGSPSNSIPAVRLLEPVAKVIETTQPTFRWTPVEGSTYELSIYDSHYEQAFSSGPLKSSEWTMPVALARGQTYSWQITAFRDAQQRRFPAPPEPEAKFEVLAGDAATHLQQLASSFGQSHLVMGAAYADAGLVDRAVAELRKLEQENPGSQVARRLVRNAAALRP